MPLGEVLKRKYNPIVQRIRKMEKPVVAAVNGVTAGAGLGLALACDLRAASEKATFHEAFIKVGLVPDSGTSFWLPRILGPGKAMEVGHARRAHRRHEGAEHGTGELGVPRRQVQGRGDKDRGEAGDRAHQGPGRSRSGR